MEAQRREPVKNLECAMQRYGIRVVTRGRNPSTKETDKVSLGTKHKKK